MTGYLNKTCLVEKIIQKLSVSGKMLSTAESCTGGLIGHLLTEIPGSSVCYGGGVVVYSNLLKEKLLEIPKDILETYGAVSKETVKMMCFGLRKLTETDCGIAVSGVAGPGGGSLQKPVGLVYIGIFGKLESPTVKQYFFQGDRKEIKEKTAYNAFLELEKIISHSIE